METLEQLIAASPVFATLAPEHLAVISGCAANEHFPAGAQMFREGDPADRFYLIRHGRVALELAAPGRAAITFQTVPEGDMVGISWLIPPYRRAYDARALDLVRAIGIDAKCLRDKCDKDHDFGYAMMMRFVPVLVERLQATRLQVLDVYGQPR